MLITLATDAGIFWTGTLAAFLADNENMDGDLIASELAAGQTVLIGGGAAPLVEVAAID